MKSLDALRSATCGVHRRLEQRLVVARDDTTTRQRQSYLAALLGWLDPVEPRLWERAAWPAQLDVELRGAKSAWLREDLRSQGLGAREIAELPRCDVQPPLDSVASRFGMAYVLEGSMLGGRVLARRWSTRQPGQRIPRYLVGYGAQTDALWSEFVVALERESAEPGFLPQAVQSARATFRSLGAWLGSWGLLR
ncbi:MAG: biliverdin-producing heme oxygenase [Planctomycetes bacterium]|nr:biliverdin-producing heme oxygenase [Planctomycetota bacterium]MCB9902712.1 biliverdin-producing heme oxygenase [Planctomycetota bacterium]